MEKTAEIIIDMLVNDLLSDEVKHCTVKTYKEAEVWNRNPYCTKPDHYCPLQKYDIKKDLFECKPDRYDK